MIRLTYCSLVFRMPRETLPEIAIVVGAQPGTTRGMALCACENDTSILTLAAIMGHQPPSALSDMLNDVTELAAPHVVEALRRAEPVGEPARFHTPSSRWRRYDKLHRFPRGLVVTGDALCSFNPVYGQGMTVAALDALALADALASGENNLAHRFFVRAAKVTRDAWNMAVESDLALSEGPSRRGFAARCSARYTDRVLRCAESNVSVAEQFWKVTNLVVPPTHLLRPGVLLPVAASLFHR
jgi:2-polyprenyl-6-methoxyphenol hydroxylase-like FAD-dependent oxidoreductase